ncbi:L-type lectin-domain containing receptor kinase S.6 [Spatholobus suberectus]|nr:L-type lectin-domain containing receptor kinase S.6 [Spatholobus suberectus]
MPYPSLLPLLLSFLLFTIPSLSLPSDNLTLYGDAFFSQGALALTTRHPSSVGRAFYVYPVRFLDPRTNSTASFSSRFSFSILPSRPASDGLAFLIADSPDSPAAAHMGLPSPQHPFFAVEFDPRLADINGNHVAVDLKSGRHVTAWVEYRHAAKTVRVWVGYSSTRPPTPILASQIDLSERVKDFMHVGFTASNGEEGSSVHLVHHWQFKTFAYDDSRSTDMLQEGDCFLCYEGDSMSDNERRKKIGEMALGLGGLTAFAVSGFAAVVVVCVFLTKKKGGGGQSCRFQTSRVPTRLSLSEIKSATMGFNRERLVGEGASAKVYRGYLPFGGDVAVKRFERDNGLDCLHNPFATEFATMVGYLRHKNLVQLKGWCCEGNELVLVYEFLPNGSLNKVLHRNFNSSVVLSWRQRVSIVLGVASALTYLHEECERQIIHRDSAVGDWLSTDEAPYLTPRSQFY